MTGSPDEARNADSGAVRSQSRRRCAWPGYLINLFLCLNPLNILAECGQLTGQMIQRSLLNHFT